MTPELERSKYMGVLLAAGHATRTGTLRDEFPKPILPIGNKPLLVHQIELLRSMGIIDITVLIGHKGYQITRVLGDGERHGVRLQFVEQKSMLGIAHALGQLENYVDRPFLLFLGDIYFVPKDIGSMFRVFEEENCGAVLATKQETDVSAIRRNFSVILDNTGKVVRVIEKPRHVVNNLKGVGLYLFDLQVFDAIRRTPRTAMRDEYEITDSIQVMIDDGHVVRSTDAVHDDLNVTYPEDLLWINLALARREHGGILVADSARVEAGAKIENTVIGARVDVPASACVTNSLVFDDVRIAPNAVIDSAIVTPRQILKCQLPR
ncbi:sugar phosphate nucleotidyltransferase [Thauera sp.]|jgi:dTDP-glucose pyrophosphorylase|uniref:sugar phosphate nucleotidyltransferase n=1 Tax=Thauera sp. TaxID=1905334 RepID=UPI002607F97F|nr:sugar phosphate nucleotidyltransferase [Thauera sp.]MCK6408545.1 NTP transferase domain-containing protein [Thauera sp.]